MHKLHVAEYGETTPPTYALLLSATVDGGWGGPWWRFDAQVVYLDGEDGKPRNLSDSHQPMAWLGVTALMSRDVGQKRPYAIEMSYDSVGRIKVQDAERMASTLRTIGRGLDKLSERFGYADDLATFVTRFMDVCGIGVAVIQTARGADGMYTSGTYRTIAPADVRYEIDRLITEGREKLDVAA